MKPVAVSIEVPQRREDVFAYLDVMANHERFTDHMLRDWTCSGPASGVGSKADVTSTLGGRPQPMAIEVIDATAGRRITERNVSAGGRREGHGTYDLSDLPEGGTLVEFTYSWQKAPLEDRALAWLVRPLMRRALSRSLERLAGELAARAPARPERA